LARQSRTRPTAGHHARAELAEIRAARGLLLRGLRHGVLRDRNEIDGDAEREGSEDHA
jgi:hypothetical protein